MIFGDESLFDGAPEDAEYAGWFCQEIRWYMILNGKILFSDGGTWCTSDNPYLSADIAAVRRIIKEPKQWTLEDKMAGRLPEVGSRIFVPLMQEEQNVIYTSKNVIISISDSDGAVTRTEVKSIDRIKPIETPAEKAQRLRSEWVKYALDLYMSSPKNDVASMGDVYDALLSGELQVPKGE